MRRSNFSSAIASSGNLIKKTFSERVLRDLYYNFNRSLQVLETITTYCSKGSFILDAGCREGFHSLALKKLGYKVIGLDKNDQYFTFLEDEGIEVLKINLKRDEIPIKDRSVDGVLFTEVLEHLEPEFVCSILKKFHRVLKPEGIIVVTTPNSESIGKLLKRIGRKPVKPNSHIHEYKMDELVSIFTDAGFRIPLWKFSLATYLNPEKSKEIEEYKNNILLETIKYPHPENLAKIFALLLSFLFPRLRGSLFLVAQK